jgi:PAS domain S-box-containing protein
MTRPNQNISLVAKETNGLRAEEKVHHNDEIFRLLVDSVKD